jgi:hypothetical protein
VFAAWVHKMKVIQGESEMKAFQWSLLAFAGFFWPVLAFAGLPNLFHKI